MHVYCKETCSSKHDLMFYELLFSAKFFFVLYSFFILFSSLCCCVDDNESYCKCRDYHHLNLDHLNLTGRLVVQKVRASQTVKFHY